MVMEITCRMCGESNQITKPKMLDDGRQEIVPSSTVIPCSKCGFNLAQAVELKENQKMGRVDEKLRHLIIWVLGAILLALIVKYFKLF